MNTTIPQLLDTADMLLADTEAPATPGAIEAVPAPSAVPTPTAVLTATAASRCRGAAFALRAALETAVADSLDANAAPPAIRDGSMRAAFLWLRSCAEAGTARRAKSVWSQLCLGCHYHQYEIGPTEDQVRTWRAEVASVVGLLSE